MYTRIYIQGYTERIQGFTDLSECIQEYIYKGILREYRDLLTCQSINILRQYRDLLTCQRVYNNIQGYTERIQGFTDLLGLRSGR